MGFAIRTDLVSQLESLPQGINDRIMTMRIPLKENRYVTLISVYAPTMTNPDETKELFYQQLDEVIRKVPKQDKLILLGDFNARVGTSSELWHGVIGQHGIGQENSNGKLLLTLCSQHKLSITNTLFQLKNHHKTACLHINPTHTVRLCSLPLAHPTSPHPTLKYPIRSQKPVPRPLLKR